MTAVKVLAELDDRGVLTITLDDADNRNVLSQQLCRELIGHLKRADTDDAVRVVVLTNTGRIFCAGADLSERSTSPATDGTPPIDPLEIFGGIRNLSKPVVGRIAGHAVAGGMGLAAACDLSVGVNEAKFGFTEVRIGVAPAIISVICLPKMRHADAADAFLRGNRFLAPEAERLGLINRAVDPEDLDAVVAEMVGDLLLGGPGALAATKQLLQQVPGMAFNDALTWASQLSSELFESEEAQEGMGAFLEKRPPRWA